MAHVIAIDIGTTKLCGVAVDECGRVLAVASRPNDAAIAGLPDGWHEQDPQRIRGLACDILRELASRVPDAPAAIGLTGQMHGLVAVDAAGGAVANLITWQDQRCLTPSGPGLPPVLDELLARVPTVAWEACGCRPAGGYMAATLLWLAQTGRTAGVARVACIADWLAGQLAGQLPVTDPTHAASAGVFDGARGAWHTEVIAAAGLPGALLPPITPSGAVIGRLTPALARGLGLPAGLPIVNAIGDNQASVLGSVAEPDAALLLNLGTGGQVSWAVPRFERHPQTETRPLPGGRFLVVGASLCGGRAYAWLADSLGGWLRACGVERSRDELYATLNALAAAAPPDAGGVRAVTTLAGTRADPAVRGALLGLGLDNFTLGNVARAVLTGMVTELAALVPADVRRGRRYVVASGNAVRRNALLREIIAAELALPVGVPRHGEEAACGAALLAGVGVGLWSDLAAAGRCLLGDRQGREATPLAERPRGAGH